MGSRKKRRRSRNPKFRSKKAPRRNPSPFQFLLRLAPIVTTGRTSSRIEEEDVVEKSDVEKLEEWRRGLKPGDLVRAESYHNGEKILLVQRGTKVESDGQPRVHVRGETIPWHVSNFHPVKDWKKGDRARFNHVYNFISFGFVTEIVEVVNSAYARVSDWESAPVSLSVLDHVAHDEPLGAPTMPVAPTVPVPPPVTMDEVLNRANLLLVEKNDALAQLDALKAAHTRCWCEESVKVVLDERDFVKKAFLDADDKRIKAEAAAKTWEGLHDTLLRNKADDRVARVSRLLGWVKFYVAVMAAVGTCGIVGLRLGQVWVKRAPVDIAPVTSRRWF